MDRSDIGGVVVPMITPLCEDGVTVHEAGVHQLVERLVTDGVHGVFVAGTTGEAWALDDEQWSHLLRFSSDALKGRLPLYVGVSQPSTAGAVSRTRMAADLGADIVVSLAPYYIPPSQDDVIRHFQTLADVSSVPVLIYQFPDIVRTSINLDSYVEMAKHPNIAGVKDSQADVTAFYQMVLKLRGDGQDFRLLLGTDVLGFTAEMMGAQGFVPGLANIGDWERSLAIQKKATNVRKLYQVVPGEVIFDGMIAGMKAALKLLGVEAGPPAAPLRACTNAEEEQIADILRNGGLLS